MDGKSCNFPRGRLDPKTDRETRFDVLQIEKTNVELLVIEGDEPLPTHLLLICMNIGATF